MNAAGGEKKDGGRNTMMNNSHEQAPRLERTLGLGSVVAIGVAYTTPLIVLGIFGVVAEQSNGTVPTAYLVTLIARVSLPIAMVECQLYIQSLVLPILMSGGR